MNASRPRVAFVVQRCGEDLAGGAESLCLQTARAMSADWDVEILTTCAREARTWANAYAPGEATIGGVAAQRFPVPVPRDPAAFDLASQRVARGETTVAEQHAWMTAQGPVAPGLFARLESHARTYDRVFFYSYLYATTFFGLPRVAARAVLVPLAHEEWMLGLPLFDALFAGTPAFVFVSDEERALVRRRFPATHDSPQIVGGAGVDAPPVDPAGFRAKYGLAGDVFVCVGRVEEAKGTAELIAHFIALQHADPQPRTLVLIGPVAMDVPRRTDILVLGYVCEAEKWDALAAATLACVPSPYESLSLAMLEAWAVGVPVLANGASAVLIGQCRRANGGLWYANEVEFVELARTRLLGQAAALGASGARYVRERYTWANVRTMLRDFVATLAEAG